MDPSKPTLLLISGAWHTPKSYSKFTDALKNNGYEVHVPRLPSMNGAKPPNADLTTDTDLIRGYVESLASAGRTIVVIMHSYGGQVGTNALHNLGLNDRKKQGLVGGVSHLVYMCASLFTEGACILDIAKEFGTADQMANASDILELFPREDLKKLMAGPGVEDADAEALVSTLTRWNGDAMFQPLERCAWREIPSTYIHTTKDVAVPFEFQKVMVEKARAKGGAFEIVELDAGHGVYLSLTAEVVKIIDGVVG
ncbi:Alpha/beta hydrolase fold-1 [Aspergillus caelatus]|uniref:Alpha/beta hydrolase fold-1 n=1 Tax=Aspergillus caelatus TaxID=61420 RepID=A0A5N7A1S2_9EURO|nr:Alpha/beta hydrolase fold-1 [Aspergillus caelatus]KAE8363807.1 Alpha/beta hydrolase fold-1 [Aspergillus caelatus]